MHKMEEARTVGIDLGTTYSCVAVLQNGKPFIIPLEEDSNTMASVVSFDENYGRKIGDKAKEDSILNPTNTISGVKRFIGCRFDDEEVQKDIGNVIYQIINENNQPKILIVTEEGTEKKFAPEEISAMILEKLKDYAKNYLKKNVTKAVITVPANFKDSQRQATQDAGRIAGLEVLRVINEPTAAALAYGIDDKYKSDEAARHIVVYDFGGGTFDVSIVTHDNGILEVKATSGDNHLGGDDIDSKLIDYFINEFEEKHEVEIKNQPRALRRLRMQCEKAKKQLSSSTVASIDIDDFYNEIDFYTSITRDKFEEICDELIQMTLAYIEDALKEAKLDKSEIDDILLVGGTTRIPKVREVLQTFFNGKYIDTSLNPMEAVALGAAVQAAILDGDDGSSTGVLLLLDVAPLSLGVETAGGVMSVIIPRNTQIPIKQTKRYSNEKDNQTKVKVIVYEGERALTSDNNKLGEFILSGIKPKPRGKAELFVTFEVDTNGVLSVTAEEVTDKGNNILTIEIEKGRLSESEIANMITKSQEMKEEDEKRKVIILAKNVLENYCYDILHKANTIVRDAEEKESIISKCETALSWVASGTVENKEEYNSKRKELHAAIFPIIKKYV